MTLDELLLLVHTVHGRAFNVKGRAVHGQSGGGAWFATDEGGRPVVLKWFDDEGVALRYEMLERALGQLRKRGYPAPEYGPILVVPGATVSVQGVLPGITGYGIGPRLVERIVELNALQEDIAAPVNPISWGTFIQHSLVEGEIGWAMHEPLRMHSPRARHLLERIERIGAEINPWRFTADGISHLDLHTGNLLLTGDDHLSGVVDWEGACDGDHRFDLVTFAHNLGTLGLSTLAEPVWKELESTLDADVLRAYVAHMVLRLVDWQIRNDPPDVEHQMDIGEALLQRYA